MKHRLCGKNHHLLHSAGSRSVTQITEPGMKPFSRGATIGRLLPSTGMSCGWHLIKVLICFKTNLVSSIGISLRFHLGLSLKLQSYLTVLTVHLLNLRLEARLCGGARIEHKDLVEIRGA